MKQYQPHSALLFALLSILLSSITQAAPCPVGSDGDRPFQMRNISQCVWTHNDHHLKPSKSVAHGIIYNIYCPGRMSVAQANQAAKSIVGGAAIREIRPDTPAVRPNIFYKQYGPLNITPTGNIAHRFHYGCRTASGRSGVATHIKIRTHFAAGTNLTALSNPQDIAKGCHKVNQSGVISAGKRMDVEYRCELISSFSRYYAREAAVILMQRDFLAEARRGRLMICVLFSTDIQNTSFAGNYNSNKLVVRIASSRNNYNGCPNDTFREIK